MTEQVPAPVAVLGQVLSVMRAGSSDVNHFGTGRGGERRYQGYGSSR